MAEKKNAEVIDLEKIVKILWANKKLFYKVLPITFFLASAFIVCIPRYYTSEAKMAPEMDNSSTGGALSSIASSFGFNLGDLQTSDAINPMLYPNLMEDNGFVTSLFSIRVKDSEGEIDTDYYTYLRKYQKNAWWSDVMSWVKEFFKSKEDSSNESYQFDPYNLSKTDDGIAEAIRSSISISVDKKTGVICVAVSAQDKLICKTVADSISEHLLTFITNYRTNKARIDLEYYTKLVAEAKENYEKAHRKYAEFADANTNAFLHSVTGRTEQLENEMSLKFSAYSTLNAQLEAARARVQERTPAFTKLKGASVPRRPAGPKRMIFVAACLIAAFICTSFYILFKK